MKTVILGSGAMGCLYGGLLAEAGFDVTLADVCKEHMDAVNERGLVIEAEGKERTIKNIRGTVDPASAGKADLVIVFVKSTVTAGAMKGAMSLVGPGTSVLTLQNGLGNVDKLSSVVGPERVIAGITGHGSTLLGPGKIRHAGRGDTIMGEPAGTISDRLKEIGAMFEKAGISVKLSENVIGLIWGKLLVNVGINALTAVTGLRNGRMTELPEAEELMVLAVEEGMNVASAAGIKLESDDPVEYTKTVARMTGPNRSSMLQDVMNKRQTEIDVINGAIVDEGRRLGVPTPVNLALANLVRIRQKSYEEFLA
ncbi:MAG: 2-dehydropantoate 2-reductase [Synergistaceae bacterium]|nr:2-dehydropantoate 2-reductase [Synergistaceae bacterium]